MVEKFIEEAIFKYFEEERIEKAMREALELSGLSDKHLKKAVKNLYEAYDEAHFKAPYGTTQGETPAISLLQDFVKGWMMDFVIKSWDIVNHGTAHAGSGTQGGIMFCTLLFQSLTDAKVSCLPNDIISLVDTPPPTPWPFVGRCAEQVFLELQAAGAMPSKKFKL